jgi:hypothetical protein
MNESEERIDQTKQAIDELAALIRQMSDSEFGKLVDTGAFDSFLMALLNPSDVQKYPSIGEFFLANKRRATLLAYLRLAITHNYGYRGSGKNGKIGYASPSHVQYFDDGVMLTEGEAPFEGLISVYRNGRLGYAVAVRDINAGEDVGPESFEFIDQDQIDEVLRRMAPSQVAKLDEPIHNLKALLDSNCNDESEYQKLLQAYPWAFGAQYRSIQRHENLDEKNIPDFTGVRTDSRGRDIFELKPPFMKLFLEDGDFSSDFNKAWNQAERYLSFAREEKDYLRRKGLIFDHPRCFLILGYGLTEEEIGRIRVKERMNPAIELLSYNDLMTFMEATVNLVRRLKIEDTNEARA